jgi:hypothetical protein
LPPSVKAELSRVKPGVGLPVKSSGPLTAGPAGDGDGTTDAPGDAATDGLAAGDAAAAAEGEGEATGDAGLAAGDELGARVGEVVVGEEAVGAGELQPATNNTAGSNRTRI